MASKPKGKGAKTAAPELIMVRVADLVPYARNSRTHSQAQIKQIQASIREFGFTAPILIKPDKTIIAGHGRTLAASAEGIEEIPALVISHMTPAQIRAYVISDNKVALNAGWDLEVLQGELEGLRDDGFDLGLTGFDTAEIDGLFINEDDLADEPDAFDKAPAREISVKFRNAADVQEFAKRIGCKITAKTTSIDFPASAGGE